MQRAFALLVVFALAASPFAPRAGHFCTHARVVMAHACCPPAREPTAPRLLCCTPVDGGASDVSELRSDGTRLALAAVHTDLSPLSWATLTPGTRPARAQFFLAPGPPIPLRV